MQATPSAAHAPRRPTRPTARSRVRFRLGKRTLSAEKAIALLAREPDKLAAQAKHGVVVEASPALLALGRAAGFGGVVDTGGEVETQGLTGLEEALIVIAVIGFVSGLAVGYLKGYENGQEGAAETEGEGDDDGGDSGGEEEEGGDDGGDGEGP